MSDFEICPCGTRKKLALLAPERLTPEEAAQAFSEGWGVFEAEFGMEIQRIGDPGDDSEPKFNNDAEAIAHVYWLAHENSPLHCKAIRIGINTPGLP